MRTSLVNIKEGQKHLIKEHKSVKRQGANIIIKLTFMLHLNSRHIVLMRWGVSCSVVSQSLWPHGLYHTRLLCPWNSPGKNTGYFIAEPPGKPIMLIDGYRYSQACHTHIRTLYLSIRQMKATYPSTHLPQLLLLFSSNVQCIYSKMVWNHSRINNAILQSFNMNILSDDFNLRYFHLHIPSALPKHHSVPYI